MIAQRLVYVRAPAEHGLERSRRAVIRVAGCSENRTMARRNKHERSAEWGQPTMGKTVLVTAHVLDACGGNRALERVVLTSTSEVYGTAQYVPIDEAHPLRGQSPYAATKIGADALGESYHRAFDLPVSILRPFNTFGA